MITIKSEEQLQKMREAGKIIGSFFAAVKDRVRPGVTTKDIDQFAEEFIRSHNAIPAFKGYHGFPGTICASVNEEVVHGIPGDRVLDDGDIIGIDVGSIIDGFHADAARTFPVGNIDEEKKLLIEVAQKALQAGIEQVKPGNRISDISHAVEEVIKPSGFGIVRQYVGHGIGKELHEEPQIPNFGPPNQGAKIEIGMAFAIEPMVNAGEDAVKVLSDQWTVSTADNKPSAHFENTVIVSENGVEVTTANG